MRSRYVRRSLPVLTSGSLTTHRPTICAAAPGDGDGALVPNTPPPPAEAARGVRANRWRGGGGLTGRPPSRLPPLPISRPRLGEVCYLPHISTLATRGERAQAISAEAVPGTRYNGTGWMRYIMALA